MPPHPSSRQTGLHGSTVVIVGAGRGLGARYAIDLASAGANVVLTSQSANAFDVASAITASGGSATAVQCDVRDPQPFVDAALDRFDRIDGLIVNAGIVRDRSFARMNGQEWQDVIDVHLGGSFACTKAVWATMTRQGRGSIVLTTSGAGLHGAFGQANYAAAKAGIIGLAKTLAIEGARNGVRVNCIAPMAMTDMTDAVFTDRLKSGLNADQVSPFVFSLLDPRSDVTGQIIECGGGWGAMLRWQRAEGANHDPSIPLDPEALLAAAADYESGFDTPGTTADSIAAAIGDPRAMQRYLIGETQ